MANYKEGSAVATAKKAASEIPKLVTSSKDKPPLSSRKIAPVASNGSLRDDQLNKTSNEKCSEQISNESNARLTTNTSIKQQSAQKQHTPSLPRPQKAPSNSSVSTSKNESKPETESVEQNPKKSSQVSKFSSEALNSNIKKPVGRTTSAVVEYRPHQQVDEKALAKKKKKTKNEKYRLFAETIGVEDNEKYKKFKKKERLIFNISNTKYFIIRFVAKNLFNFKLSYKNQDPGQMDNWNYENEGRLNDDWDIFWSDAGIQPDRISKMKPYQKCNHYPGMFQLARKNHMARNLMKMQKEFDKAYKFFPRTFILPSEFGEFKQTFANKAPVNRPVYIVKPEAGCQGRGIFLTNNFEDLNADDHYVVQQYIKKPMLIEDLKFDIRLYVMLLSVDPLRIYLFKEGMARFSTEPYKQPTKKNMTNMFMHLTNYSINCRNKGKFVFNKGLDDADQGHKRTFSSILEHIQENYENGEQKCDELMHKIEQLIIKTFITVLPSLRHYQNIPNKGQLTQEALDGTYNKNKNRVNSLCFEILGFDVLIDEKLKPWLIEINTAPSFATDTPFDFKIKKDVVADALQLLKMSYKLKRKFIKSHKSKVQKRMLQQKKLPPSGNIQGSNLQNSNQKNKQSTSNQDASLNPIINSTKITSSQKFAPLDNNTPKNVSKIEESHTQKKSGTSKMADEIMNIVTQKKDKISDRGDKVSRSRVASAKERKSSRVRPISARTQDKNYKKSSGCPKPESSSRQQDDSDTFLGRRHTPIQSDTKAADDITEEDSLSPSDSKSDELETDEKTHITNTNKLHSEAEDDDSSQDDEDDDRKVKNGYKQIYPSKRNTEEEYKAFIDHAHYCYEQFTGSYSKKNREAREQKLQQERQNEIKAQRMMNYPTKEFNIRQQRTIQSPQKPLKFAKDQNFDHRLSQSTSKQPNELGQNNLLSELKAHPPHHNMSHNQLHPDDIKKAGSNQHTTGKLLQPLQLSDEFHNSNGRSIDVHPKSQTQNHQYKLNMQDNLHSVQNLSMLHHTSSFQQLASGNNGTSQQPMALTSKLIQFKNFNQPHDGNVTFLFDGADGINTTTISKIQNSSYEEPNPSNQSSAHRKYQSAPRKSRAFIQINGVPPPTNNNQSAIQNAHLNQSYQQDPGIFLQNQSNQRVAIVSNMTNLNYGPNAINENKIDHQLQNKNIINQSTVYTANRILKHNEIMGSGLHAAIDSNRETSDHNQSQLVPLNGNSIANQQQIVSSIKKGNTKLQSSMGIFKQSNENRRSLGSNGQFVGAAIVNGNGKLQSQVHNIQPTSQKNQSNSITAHIIKQQMQNKSQQVNPKNQAIVSDYSSSQGRHNTDRLKHLSQSSIQKYPQQTTQNQPNFFIQDNRICQQPKANGAVPSNPINSHQFNQRQLQPSNPNSNLQFLTPFLYSYIQSPTAPGGSAVKQQRVKAQQQGTSSQMVSRHHNMVIEPGMHIRSANASHIYHQAVDKSQPGSMDQINVTGSQLGQFNQGSSTQQTNTLPSQKPGQKRSIPGDTELWKSHKNVNQKVYRLLSGNRYSKAAKETGHRFDYKQ